MQSLSSIVQTSDEWKLLKIYIQDSRVECDYEQRHETGRCYEGIVDIKRAQNVLVDIKLTKHVPMFLNKSKELVLVSFEIFFYVRGTRIFKITFIFVVHLHLIFSEFYSSSLSSSLLLSNVFFVGAYICNSLGIT